MCYLSENESLKPIKLKLYLSEMHNNLQDKYIDYVKSNEIQMNCVRLDNGENVSKFNNITKDHIIYHF